MPRQTKTSKTSDAVESVPVVATSVAAPVTAAVDAATKTKRAAKVPKLDVAPVTTVAPVVADASIPVVADASVPVVATSSDFESSDLAVKSGDFLVKLNQLSTVIANLKTEYRNLEKQWTKELKVAQKTSSKKKRKTGNRAPSGFVKPALISNELATFLGKASGTEMARTDVTREINEYIRLHKLQDKANGRKINPDAKLKSLLKVNDTDELTYFNLQRYMSPHFTKSDKTLVKPVSA
jgi:upstream activation factor subunit UAF30